MNSLGSVARPLVCGQCGVENEKLRICSRCKEVRYCSKECQTIAWKTHKVVCVDPSDAFIKQLVDLEMGTISNGLLYRGEIEATKRELQNCAQDQKLPLKVKLRGLVAQVLQNTEQRTRNQDTYVNMVSNYFKSSALQVGPVLGQMKSRQLRELRKSMGPIQREINRLDQEIAALREESNQK